MAQEADLAWYSVRCIFRCRPRRRRSTYEERITLWRAASFEEAIAKAESEAAEYAKDLEAFGFSYLGLAQAFKLFDQPGEAVEVFSLARDSKLKKRKYLDTFFDTGRERQGGMQEN